MAKSCTCHVLIYVNKMDMENADFFGSLERMRELFGKSVMPLQVPIGEGADFHGIIDVPTMKAYEWVNGERQECEIPADLQDRVEEVSEMCMEAAAEGSDELTEKYLEGEPLTLDEIYEGPLSGHEERPRVPSAPRQRCQPHWYPSAPSTA